MFTVHLIGTESRLSLKSITRTVCSFPLNPGQKMKINPTTPAPDPERFIASQNQPAQKFLLIIIAVCGWFALGAQMKINIESKAAPLTEIIVRYFSYFTLLTNLIVTVVCMSLLFWPRSAV